MRRRSLWETFRTPAPEGVFQFGGDPRPLHPQLCPDSVHIRDWATQGHCLAEDHRVALGVSPTLKCSRRPNVS
jgi:hypothetical protein